MNPLGYVVIEVRQTGGYDLPHGATLHRHKADAHEEADARTAHTATTGRRDTYHVAAITLQEET